LALAVLWCGPGPASPASDAAVREMLRRVVTAPEVESRVLIERSDPFGGPPDRQSGRLWYLPGRGLRFRADGRDGQDLVLDRSQESFLLYVPGEEVVYRAPFSRGPAKLRRLITDPERLLTADFRAVPERRVLHGDPVAGYRLRPAALGDSLPEAALWIAGDPRSGLPRWLAVETEADSVLVELKSLSVRKTARPGDLTIRLPAGTREEPLDPRELLERGAGESR
jgi:hypothetical protein